jgi:hypothetical protein
LFELGAPPFQLLRLEGSRPMKLFYPLLPRDTIRGLGLIHTLRREGRPGAAQTANENPNN